MTDVQDFNHWLAQGADAAVNNADVALQVSRETKPDELAADIQLGKAFNVPAGVASANRDTLNQRLQSLQNQTYLSRAPLLTDWMVQDPNHAALAQDDLEHLSGLESFARGFVNTGKRAVARLGAMGSEFIAERFANRYRNRGKSFSELAQENAFYTMPDGSKLTGLGGYISAAASYLDARLGESMHVNDAAVAKSAFASEAAFNKSMADAPMPISAQEFAKVAFPQGVGALDSVKSVLHAVVQNPIGALVWGLATAGESAPQLAAAAGVGAVTKSPNAAIAALGAGSYLTERYTSPADFFAEKGVDIGNPQDVERLINDPVMMKEAADRGVIRGAIIGLFDAISGGVGGKTLAHNPVIESVAQTAQQALSGASGEYFARKASGQKVEWSEVSAEAVGEAAGTPVELGLAGHEFHKQQQSAKLAVAQKEAVGKFLDTAEKSKLKNRPGGKFEEFMKKALDNTGLKDFFIPAEQVKQYAQPDDGRTLGIDLRSPDFEAMVNMGQDVRVSAATYAANVVGTPLDAKLRDHIRLDPEAMTFAEAKDFNAKSEEALQQAFAEAEKARTEELAMRSDEAKIYDEMVHQLRSAGRSTEVATAEALIYPAFYRTMAARLGQDVKALVDKFVPPAVRGELPEGLKVKDVSELDRRIEELRMIKQPKADTRQNLLGFIDQYGGINDPGGELKARDATVIKQGKGKKTLRLRRDTSGDGQGNFLGPAGISKHGMENVALAAINAGFMANDPAVLDYKEAVRTGRQTPDLGAALIDAIDRELAGQHDYAGVDHADAEKQVMLLDAEQHLAGLGVSLSDSNAVIKTALERDGKRYNQIDPLDDPNADWRNLAISANLEDGETVKVHAGDVVDHLRERMKAAQELLDCLNA